MTKNVPFQTVVEALLDDGHPFPARYLHRFSDLEPPDLQALLEAWPRVSLPRKQALLEDLEDLAETDTLTCFDDLARALLTDPQARVRTPAIRLLWECEDARLVPLYLEILENDEDGETRAAAANALGQFVYLGELEKIPAETHHQIEDRLLATTASTEEALVRRRALESLGYSGREEVPPLIEAAYRHEDPAWVASALNAMGRSSDERWKKQVIAQLRSPDEEVRSEAIHAAGELELGSARPILLDLLADEEDLALRRELVWALSKIGGEGVRARLEELAEIEADDDEVEFLEEALGNLTFTDDMAHFNLFDFDPDDDLEEEE